jgi:acetoin utilization protein AcuB
MKKGKLVGILTDRDLKRASASDATSLEIHELFYLLQNLKQELEAKAALLYMIDHAGNNREIFAEKII